MTTAEEYKRIVLVIEDDTMIRRMLCAALHKMNFRTVEAPTGSSGLHAFKKTNPDLVITDLIMPDENGLQAILKIRAAKPDVKIIAISGGGRKGSEDILETARDLGARVTIKKPFTMTDIEKAVAAALQE